MVDNKTKRMTKEHSSCVFWNGIGLYHRAVAVGADPGASHDIDNGHWHELHLLFPCYSHPCDPDLQPSPLRLHVSGGLCAVPISVYRTHHLLLLWALLACLAAELAEPLLPVIQSPLPNVELPGEGQGKRGSCIAPADCERGSSLGPSRGGTVGMEVQWQMF